METYTITQEDLNTNPILEQLGLTEGSSVTTDGAGHGHSCPKGFSWNGSSCVPDVG